MLSERRENPILLSPYPLLYLPLNFCLWKLICLSALCLSPSCPAALPHSQSASSSFSVFTTHDREFLLEASLWLLPVMLLSQDGWWDFRRMSDRFKSIRPEPLSALLKLTPVSLSLFHDRCQQPTASYWKPQRILVVWPPTTFYHDYNLADLMTREKSSASDCSLAMFQMLIQFP